MVILNFDENFEVIEPKYGYLNTPYCKDDMKDTGVPCILYQNIICYQLADIIILRKHGLVNGTKKCIWAIKFLKWYRKQGFWFQMFKVLPENWNFQKKNGNRNFEESKL